MKAALIIERKGSNPCASYQLYNNVFERIDSNILNIPNNNIWIAELLGFSEVFNFKRRFLKYQRDYSEANGSGSRGIYDTFILETGKFYEVKDSEYRYFCKVDSAGDIVKIEKQEVIEWLKKA